MLKAESFLLLRSSIDAAVFARVFERIVQYFGRRQKIVGKRAVSCSSFMTPPMPPSRYQGAFTHGRRRIFAGSCAYHLACRDAAVL